MIKLPRRPCTTRIRAGDCDRWRDIIRWGQEFPRVLLATGNASGNESEIITIPTESQPWACEIKLRRNRASEADQRDYPGKYVRTATIRGIDENARVLSVRKKQLPSSITIRQGCRSGFGDGIIPKSLKICTGEWGMGNGDKILFPTPHSPLPIPHSLLPTPHLTQLARERIAVLPAGSPCEAEIFEPPDGDFAEDRVNIHRQTSSPGHLSGQERRA